jgi:hypothetical protein
MAPDTMPKHLAIGLTSLLRHVLLHAICHPDDNSTSTGSSFRRGAALCSGPLPNSLPHDRIDHPQHRIWRRLMHHMANAGHTVQRALHDLAM